MNMTDMDLAHYDSLRKWEPQVGDFVVWHGWFQHYFGVVSSILREESSIEVIKKGIPMLLFAMSPEQHDKNKIKINVGDIKGSTGGKYAAIRASGNNIVWYV